MRWWLVAFVVLTLVADKAGAQVVKLRELERKALQFGVFAETHAARARGSEAELRKAAAAYYPQVALRADVSGAPGRKIVTLCSDGMPATTSGHCANDPHPIRVSGARSISSGFGAALVPQQLTTINLTANATLYDFGRTKAAVAAGQDSLEAVRAERDSEAQAVVNDVRARYLYWLQAHEQFRISEDAARDAAERYQRVESLVEQGSRPRAELAPAQSDALLTKLELTRAQGELDDARITLEEVVGEPLPGNAEPDASMLETERGVTPLSEATDALEKVIERQRHAARSLELSYKRSNRPQIGVNLLVGFRSQAQSNFPLYVGGLSFFAPLYDGGIAAAAAAGARAQQDALASRLRDHGRQQERLHAKAERDARQALDSLAIAEELLTVAQKRLSDAQAGYDLGVNGIDQIASARALCRRAQSEVLQSKLAHADARLRFAPMDLSP